MLGHDLPARFADNDCRRESRPWSACFSGGRHFTALVMRQSRSSSPSSRLTASAWLARPCLCSVLVQQDAGIVAGEWPVRCDWPRACPEPGPRSADVPAGHRMAATGRPMIAIEAFRVRAQDDWPSAYSRRNGCLNSDMRISRLPDRRWRPRRQLYQKTTTRNGMRISI